jgi:hypothetical protein
LPLCLLQQPREQHCKGFLLLSLRRQVQRGIAIT